MAVILSKLLSFKEFSLFVMLSNKNYIDLELMLDRFCDGCLIKQSISILGVHTFADCYIETAKKALPIMMVGLFE